MLRAPAKKWSFTMGLAMTALVAEPAQARTEASSSYSKAQTFSAALRYVRVDLGYEVTEKDPDAAYVLFRFTPSGEHSLAAGSVEVIETEQEVKLLIQIAELPSYYETLLRDGLLRKLQAEYGAPVTRPNERSKGKKKDRAKDKERDRARGKTEKDDKDQPQGTKQQERSDASTEATSQPLGRAPANQPGLAFEPHRG